MALPLLKLVWIPLSALISGEIDAEALSVPVTVTGFMPEFCVSFNNGTNFSPNLNQQRKILSLFPNLKKT